VMDSVHLHHPPLASMRAAKAPSVPLLIGTTRNESAFFGSNAARDGVVGQLDLANMPLDAFTQIYRHYDTLMPDASPTDRRYAALTAEEYWVPSINAACAHAAGGGNAWLYRLDMPRDRAPNAGYSVHGSELPLVWDKTHDRYNGQLGPQGKNADRLSALMFAQWVSFIRYGRPADAHWAIVDDAAPATMVFNEESRLVRNLDDAQRAVWKEAAFDFS
jgi:para-nitrobenzyl esterase